MASPTSSPPEGNQESPPFHTLAWSRSSVALPALTLHKLETRDHPRILEWPSSELVKMALQELQSDTMDLAFYEGEEPVAILFDSIPDVELHHNTGGSDECWDKFSGPLRVFYQHCIALRNRDIEFSDPDTANLEQTALMLISKPATSKDDLEAVFLTALQYINIGSQIDNTSFVAPRDDGTNKSKWLRYAWWTLMGRLDEYNPFDASPTRHDPAHYANLVVQTAQQDKKCTRQGCGATNAVGVCNRCRIDEPWAYVGASYCSSDCQRQDWDTHKAVCDARRQLFRAVGIGRELSTIFEKHTLGVDFDVAAAKKPAVGHLYPYRLLLTKFSEFPREDRVLIPEAFKGSSVLRNAGDTRIVDFQPSAPYDDANEAILRDLWFDESLPAERIFWEPLLKECCSKYEVLYVCPKNAPYFTFRPQTPHKQIRLIQRHPVILATSKSGEEFIIDMMGGQLGYRETLALREHFEQTRACRIEGRHDFGPELDRIEKATLLHQPADSLAVHKLGLKKSIAQPCVDLIKKPVMFLSGQQYDLATLLALKPAEFQARRHELLKDIRTSLNIVSTLAVRGAGLRLCLTKQMTVRVASTHEHELYKDIWLTEAEWAPIQEDPDKLMALWNKKLARSPYRDAIKEDAEADEHGQAGDGEEEAEADEGVQDEAEADEHGQAGDGEEEAKADEGVQEEAEADEHGQAGDGEAAPSAEGPAGSAGALGGRESRITDHTIHMAGIILRQIDLGLWRGAGSEASQEGQQ